MSGAQGFPQTYSGAATTTETPVTLVSAYTRGAPNSNGSRPTPPALSTFLRGDLRIANNDATNNLVVRLNGTVAVVTVLPKQQCVISKILVFALSVRSSASTVAYEIQGVSS